MQGYVLFVINYKVLTIHGKENKESYWLVENTPQSVARQLSENASSIFLNIQLKIRFLKLMKMQGNKVEMLNENVDK